MITRPKLSDWQIIGFYTGKIIVGVGLMMLLPLVIGIVFREWSAAVDFIIGISIALTIGHGLQVICRKRREMTWMPGLVTAAFSWLVAMVVGAVPHYLSGHFGSFFDASFDLMSGITTTGLYLLQDLDHISYSLNMWRHLLTYVGGQGIVVVALTFLIRGSAGAFMMYVGEGKDEKLLPNVIQTARALWIVSLTYMVVGGVLLTAANLYDGMAFTRAFLQGWWIFMGSWSTGGFAPQSFNILYYHSLLIELLTMTLFIIGSFNFALHWAVWTGNRREVYRNIEIVSFITTLFITVTLGSYALLRIDAFRGTAALFRKSFYQIVSAHTGTGLTNMYPRQFSDEWGGAAMLAVIIAMALGGSAASTSGGFKAMRVGIITRSFMAEIRSLTLPESAVLVEKIHHIKDRYLNDKQIQSSMMIVLAFIFIYLGGGVIGSLYGYPFIDALFESGSAGATVGLSSGVTSPDMPTGLKAYFMFVMWIGRLEFIAVFALIGFIVRVGRGK